MWGQLSRALPTPVVAPAAGPNVGLMALAVGTPVGSEWLLTLPCTCMGVGLRTQVAAHGQGVRRRSLMVKADEV